MCFSWAELWASTTQSPFSSYTCLQIFIGAHSCSLQPLHSACLQVQPRQAQAYSDNLGAANAVSRASSSLISVQDLSLRLKAPC